MAKRSRERKARRRTERQRVSRLSNARAGLAAFNAAVIEQGERIQTLADAARRPLADLDPQSRALSLLVSMMQVGVEATDKAILGQATELLRSVLDRPELQEILGAAPSAADISVRFYATEAHVSAPAPIFVIAAAGCPCLLLLGASPEDVEQNAEYLLHAQAWLTAQIEARRAGERVH